MLMVTVPPKTKRGDLSGTKFLPMSFYLSFIRQFGNHNTMLFMFNAFHV